MIITGYGHPNITGRHLTTIQFTSAPDVSPRGDCIVSCRVSYDVKKLQALISDAGEKKLRITIHAGDVEDVVVCDPNPAFNDPIEIVIRMSSVATSRTLGIRADKGAAMLSRELLRKLQNPDQKIEISIEQCLIFSCERVRTRENHVEETTQER